MNTLPFFFSVASAVLLVLGFGGAFRGFDSAVFMIVLFLAISALALATWMDVNYRLYTKVVAGGVILACAVLVAQSAYMKKQRSIEAKTRLAEVIEESRRKRMPREADE